ncbi:MAG: histidine--tRNA ligase, partial [Magnetospirillum sp.]|nr:histidine--tRNA ligase [Magnetospirillum sp.]
EINSLGDAESRAAYRSTLVAYLSEFRSSLSEDSRNRLDRNPLRVLDSKDEGDRRIIENAPLMSESLSPAAREFFSQVTEGLKILGIPFILNPRLVRGLDYYCHTAFEFTTTALGAQGTVLAGGRYDELISTMGGPRTPGIGWAAGVERLSMLVDHLPGELRPISVIPMGDVMSALAVSERLRRAGHTVEMGFSGNMKKRMARASKVNARFAIILGEEEAARGAVTIRDLDTSTQDEVPLASLEEHLGRSL